MPNIKSSIQSVKSDAERRAKNVAVKSTVKTAFRKVNDAVKAGNTDDVKSLLAVACKKIDKAAADNIYHKNAAARRKSRLAKKVNASAK
ncbi:30S ribosomal protein S20 [Pectinatus cerevisiiphilus]|uniref:Small ribosomal subunit protein bS20 n=1 Tax=Pectinatus cerevisiiphilus TaxID=86956 RepID=A0A4V2URS4_9FIRM|nr:30S ribosomal protein S20 [Pectinatus cerevisiiphilus]TCS78712.1 small subunit ribosomal protein S20 [Pectinatus cerevisiiphilus]